MDEASENDYSWDLSERGGGVKKPLGGGDLYSKASEPMLRCWASSCSLVFGKVPSSSGNGMPHSTRGDERGRLLD